MVYIGDEKQFPVLLVTQTLSSFYIKASKENHFILILVDYFRFIGEMLSVLKDSRRPVGITIKAEVSLPWMNKFTFWIESNSSPLLG